MGDDFKIHPDLWTLSGPQKALLEASDRGDAAAVRSLLSDPDTGLLACNPDDVLDGGGFTPLDFAAQGGHLDVARALVDARADPARLHRKCGFNPLQMAAANGHVGVVRVMLDNNVDPDEGGSSFSHTGTAMQAAVHSGHADVARVLLEAGADVHAWSRNGMAIHLAAMRRNEELIEMLLLWGASPDITWSRGMYQRPFTARELAVNGETFSPRNRLFYRNSRSEQAGVMFDRALERARVRWSPGLHARLPRPVRNAVVTVMLCASRIVAGAECECVNGADAASGACGASAAAGGAPGPVALPPLPTELWLIILGMIRAVDFIPPEHE